MITDIIESFYDYIKDFQELLTDIDNDFWENDLKEEDFDE